MIRPKPSLWADSAPKGPVKTLLLLFPFAVAGIVENAYATESEATSAAASIRQWKSFEAICRGSNEPAACEKLNSVGEELAKRGGRPSYHPSTLLTIYLYGYLNRVQSSRRLEREAQRNVELMWLTGRLAPDFKTIANFRRDNGAAIRAACAQFMVLCRQLGLFTRSVVAIDGSRFKAVNNHGQGRQADGAG
jgi:transposase